MSCLLISCVEWWELIMSTMERPRSVIGKIDSLVSAVKNKCSDWILIVSGLFYRRDNPHLYNSINSIPSTTYYKIPSLYMSNQATMQSFHFIVNFHCKRDRLHLNLTGKMLIVKTLLLLLTSSNNLLFTIVGNTMR